MSTSEVVDRDRAIDSIGYWDSFAVEAVTIVLMIFGTLNFLTSYFSLRGKQDIISWRSILKLAILYVVITSMS